MTALRALALLVLAISASAGATAAEVEISDAWARASVGANGVAYFTARNHGPATAIIGIASATAATAALHGHVMDGEVMRMRPLDRLALAAGESVILAPGGPHVMLMRLVAPLVEGDSLALTVRFEDGSQTTVTVPVLGIAAMAR